eukprot:m.298636 g.298636  ORF g.298636 m.298636 type:complete len:345 (-) comp20093_c0_seq5:385-1419(-)
MAPPQDTPTASLVPVDGTDPYDPANNDAVAAPPAAASKAGEGVSGGADVAPPGPDPSDALEALSPLQRMNAMAAELEAMAASSSTEQESLSNARDASTAAAGTDQESTQPMTAEVATPQPVKMDLPTMSAVDKMTSVDTPSSQPKLNTLDISPKTATTENSTQGKTAVEPVKAPSNDISTAPSNKEASPPTSSGDATEKTIIVVALGTYTAKKPDQLSLVKKDKYVVLQNEKNWWLVRNSAGEEGRVPSNYLRVLDGAAAAVATKTPTTAPASAAPPPPVAAAVDTRPIVMAVAKYEPKKPDQIPLVKHQKLRVIDSSRNWWLVETEDGVQGRVPSNFLKKESS